MGSLAFKLRAESGRGDSASLANASAPKIFGSRRLLNRRRELQLLAGKFGRAFLHERFCSLNMILCVEGEALRSETHLED